MSRVTQRAKDESAVTFGKLERAPAYRIVYDAILGEIVSGSIEEGRLLPSEQRLAEQFGINRSTVREGIRLLEESGVLRREFGKRLIVCRPAAVDAGRRMSQVMVLHNVTLREVLDATSAIEVAAAGAAARKRSQDDLQKLEAVLALARDALAAGAQTRLVALDFAFHDRLLEAAQNRAASLLIEPLLQLLEPMHQTVYATVPELSATLLDKHVAIAQAVASSDTETARRWMERRVAEFQSGCELAGFALDGPIRASQAPARTLPLTGTDP